MRLAASTLRGIHLERRATVGIDGQRTGTGTAFSALAPSKRPVFAAHRSNIREWYCPQARIADRLTFRPLFSSSPRRGFLLALSALSRSVARLPHTAW
jgi:hypothetical protein